MLNNNDNKIIDLVILWYNSHIEAMYKSLKSFHFSNLYFISVHIS